MVNLTSKPKDIFLVCWKVGEAGVVLRPVVGRSVSVFLILFSIDTLQEGRDPRVASGPELWSSQPGLKNLLADLWLLARSLCYINLSLTKDCKTAN